MQKASKHHHPGIRARHSRRCRSLDGGTCNCSPSFEAWAFDKRTNTKIRKTFPTLAAAKTWRQDAMPAIRKGTMIAPTSITLREAAEAFLAGAENGTFRARNGQGYRPSVTRSYRQSLNKRVLPDYGARKLGDVTRFDLQDLVDRMLAEGLSPSTIQNTLMPLRAIYRRALQRGEVAVNPTTLLEIPAGGGRRDRIAPPDEAERLLGALPVGDRALWATAIYAGLRRGELFALRWEDVDFDGGVVKVRRSWDTKARIMLEPKTRAGVRTVPLASVLRAQLREHQLFTARRSGLVFGGDGVRPPDPDAVRERGQKCWTRARMSPIGLHERRHTFASFMIAAGVNAKALSTYMGHSSITITLDRYGHLMPGSEDEAAGLLDSYLDAATGAHTGAQGS